MFTDEQRPTTAMRCARRSATAPALLPRAGSIREPNAIDRRQIVADVLPPLSLVFADEEIAGGAAERECSAIGIDVEPVTVDDVVGMFLRQPFGEHLEALAAVARARDDERAVDGIAPLIFLSGHEPRGSGLFGMHDDGEPEHRRLRVRDLRARDAAVRAAEDTV